MKRRIKKNTKAPMLAALLCAALLIVSIFLPYFTAKAEYVEFLEAMEQDTSLSLYDFAVLYLEDNNDALAKVLGILGGLTALATVFAYFRKPVLVMVFDVLATGLAVIIRMIFSGSNYAYVFSIGSWLCFVAFAGMLASAIWMLVVKSQTKKKFAARKQKMETLEA